MSDLNDNQKPMDHEYDGIQEYDNPLPNWWLMIFLGTIIFAFIYTIHYSVGGGQTQVQELKSDLARLPKPTEKVWQEDELKEKIDSPESIKMGAVVFAAKCSACHGPQGQGMIGPNLTDKFWIHGQGKRQDIIQVVTKGVLEKGMPSWSGLIPDNDILAVVGYVYSLRGTNPPNPKAPQGTEVKD